MSDPRFTTSSLSGGKPALSSNTVRGGAVATASGVAAALAASLLPQFGFTPEETTTIVTAIAAVGPVIGGIVAIVCRIQARERIH